MGSELCLHKGMVIDAEAWMKSGMVIGAIATPLYVYVSGQRTTIREKFSLGTCISFVVVGAMLGWLLALVLVAICGGFGAKMP
jgi:hypothetical protein